MSRLKPGVQHAMRCSPSDEPCTDTAAGHAMSALRERVTAATPSKWRDAIVTSVASDGWLSVVLLDAEGLDADPTVWLWNHADRSARITVGEPVALHALYGTLAHGAERLNVVRRGD